MGKIEIPKRLSNQQAEEREIIKKFLHTAGIKTQPNGIQSLNPPSPDVLCTLIDGNTIAFELTEAIDPKVVRNYDFSKSGRWAMYDYFKKMPFSEREKLRRIFGNAHLSFCFDDKISKSGFRQLLRDLFQFLLECSPNIQGHIKGKLLPNGVKQIHITRGEFAGPMFNNISHATYYADKTIERITKKFNKRYKCDCPAELLVYSRKGLPPNILWLPNVQKLIAQKLDNNNSS